MNPKIIIGAIVVVAFIVYGSMSFLESNLEYTDITGGIKANKKVQLKGEWNRDKEYKFDPKSTEFTFFLVDEKGRECKVVLAGGIPNNFEMATSVVATGRFNEDGTFNASQVLTKCPSKYEADGSEVKKMG